MLNCLRVFFGVPYSNLTKANGGSKMRKVEQQMNDAIAQGINWAGGNTMVTDNDGLSRVYLHGNHIATVDQDTRQVVINAATFAQYPTNTTKSRLRALGCNLKTRKGVTYLNDVAIEELNQ